MQTLLQKDFVSGMSFTILNFQEKYMNMKNLFYLLLKERTEKKRIQWEQMLQKKTWML